MAQALRDASTERELYEASAAVVAFALGALDHRHLVEDLDCAWPHTRACRSAGTGEIATLTSVLRWALEKELACIGEAAGKPLGTLLAFFDFVAELCWANYLSPSDHMIRKALRALVANGCSVGRSVAAYFLTVVGPILGGNPLEVFMVLDPLVAVLVADVEAQPRCTQWFVWVLLQRYNTQWEGSVYLEVQDSFWREDWALARLLFLAARKEDPALCPLAVLPSNAGDIIAAALCPRSPLDAASVVWEQDGQVQRISEWHGGLSEALARLQCSSMVLGRSSSVRRHEAINRAVPSRVDAEAVAESEGSSGSEEWQDD